MLNQLAESFHVSCDLCDKCCIKMTFKPDLVDRLLADLLIEDMKQGPKQSIQHILDGDL